MADTVIERAQEYLTSINKDFESINNAEEGLYTIIEKLYAELVDNKTIDSAKVICNKMANKPSYDEVLGVNNIDNLPEDLLNTIDEVYYAVHNSIYNVETCLSTLSEVKQLLFDTEQN